jgi:CRISPR/Cas system-associated protein Csm6
VSYSTEITKDIDTENSSTTDATMQTSQNVDKDDSQSSKITKIIFPATNNSKTRQIAEILEQDLRQKFVDRKCYTQIIFL